MPEASTVNDQIRGMAMALRHWFEVTETDELMVAAGLRGDKADGLFSRKTPDRRFQALTITALPPQVVRLKADAPMTTLHLLQDVYDDGELRADPWRCGDPLVGGAGRAPALLRALAAPELRKSRGPLRTRAKDFSALATLAFSCSASIASASASLPLRECTNAPVSR